MCHTHGSPLQSMGVLADISHGGWPTTLKLLVQWAQTMVSAMLHSDPFHLQNTWSIVEGCMPFGMKHTGQRLLRAWAQPSYGILQTQNNNNNNNQKEGAMESQSHGTELHDGGQSKGQGAWGKGGVAPNHQYKVPTTPGALTMQCPLANKPWHQCKICSKHAPR